MYKIPPKAGSRAQSTVRLKVNYLLKIISVYIMNDLYLIREIPDSKRS